MTATGRAQEEIWRLRQTFETLDYDKDGVLPLQDLRQTMALEPSTAADLTMGQRKILLKKADEQTGSLTFKQFAILATSPEVEENMSNKLLLRTADFVIPQDQRPVMHSYLRSYGCIPPPVFMVLISIAEIGVFLYYTLSRGAVPGWFKGCGGCRSENGHVGPLVFTPEHREQAWRFISYMFVHAGIAHLLSNLLLQLLLGIPLELVHKLWRIGPLYIVGVLLGAMCQYILDPSVMLVGASGGVYALITAHLANVILMPYNWIRLVLIVVFVGLDAGHVIYRRVGLGACDKVSYAAHIGGAVTGLLLGLILLKNIHKLKWEKILAWVALSVYVLLFVAGVVLTVLVKPYQSPILDLRCNVTTV